MRLFWGNSVQHLAYNCIPRTHVLFQRILCWWVSEWGVNRIFDYNEQKIRLLDLLWNGKRIVQLAASNFSLKLNMRNRDWDKNTRST